MSETKKYYYLKLKEGFFDTDEMKLLQAMEGGYLYSDILLKMYLRSLGQEGRLMYRGSIPYTPEMIAALTGHPADTAKKALDVLKQLGFIEILDNGAIYMTDIQNFIGQSSSKADRVRNYRNTINAEKSEILDDDVTNVHPDVQSGVQMFPTGGTNVPHKGYKCSPEIRDKRLEIKNNNIKPFARSSDSQSSEPEAEADVAPLVLNDGSEWRPPASLFAEYVRLYPNVDVKQQFNEMRSWCLSNATKRKTRRGIKRFVNSWLSREQDAGPKRGGQYHSAEKSKNRFNNFEQRQYDYASLEQQLLGGKRQGGGKEEECGT